MKSARGKHTERIVGVAVFSALAVVVALICNVIPPVAGFLSFDVKDAVITTAALIWGPISAVAISFLAALIELLTFSTTGWYGFLMNFVSSAIFSLTASLIYTRKRTVNVALVAMFCAVITTTGAMLLMNIFVTPLYLAYIGVPPEAASSQVMGMLPTVLLPFNFAKTLFNSAAVMLIYKPVTTALKRTGMRERDSELKLTRSTVTVLIAGGLSLILSLIILFMLSS